MKIKVYKNEKGHPENLLANVEIYLDGSFAGLKITGISIWRGKDGVAGQFVTLPSKEYSKDGERKFYEFLRSDGKDTAPLKHLKQHILEAWENENEPAPF